MLVKCSRCGKVYCFRWTLIGTENENLQKTTRSVETTKDYYAGEGVFKGRVMSRNRDYVSEKTTNIKNIYGVYNCRCVYCNNTVRKKVYEKTERE